MVQCFTGSAGSVPTAPVPVLDVCGGLLELFSGGPCRAPGGRSGQGRDHPTAAVLALAAAAVVAGMKGYTAITGWVADVSAAVLADLYLRAGAIPAGPPSKTTIWRVLTDRLVEIHKSTCTVQGINSAKPFDIPAELVVLVTPNRPRRQIFDELSARGGLKTFLIGDAKSPRDLQAAIHEGHRTARRILDAVPQ